MNVRHVDETSDARTSILHASASAIRRDPSVLWAIATSSLRLARNGWWRRAPFLPLPDERYWRFRMETAYGDERATVGPDDVAVAARWSRRARSARR